MRRPARADGSLWFTDPSYGTFGGAKRNQLLICATSSLYSIMVNVTGVSYPAPAPLVQVSRAA